ncbi:MAG TPA: GNAT family N-acetyltransferase [Mesorhizobium sp.]|jgi:predicted GNAT family acetyltransferase|uniref:GNAT family N-acetyltransferase n=1 Tax=Mesorhizobium sp. TaxID=1871066 RepID=UPI002DDCBD29|nr:GNAT family N-acetyltransferase [Mesorhizobium sp.]HEV2503065.1 GNAT family N-acetyltransferase [Mesorhizobium sp.]
MTPLDRPIWSALTSRHAHLCEGGSQAKRYQPTVSAFAATLDDSPSSQRALFDLSSDGRSLLFLQADTVVVPPGMMAVSTAAAVQMTASQPATIERDDHIERLGEADLPAMQSLAELTKPGPFTVRALDLGAFWGMKDNGRLLAMAGERMKPQGFSEISGVCSHPDARGRGLAKRLSMFVAGRILERGEDPFLHAYATNTAAIALYESIGFSVRSTMHVAVLQRAPN